ncbi:hypothetical protein BB561_002758 [Smittium simulii]|uniref:Uncharacterized protein n=1 Tax=Smittium simulii TaxID=133385 RepID=A0A2T9YPB8_9FUNG|nr:hypothetical protein BB561_002758 [Smittium simulii]
MIDEPATTAGNVSRRPKNNDISVPLLYPNDSIKVCSYKMGEYGKLLKDGYYISEHIQELPPNIFNDDYLARAVSQMTPVEKNMWDAIQSGSKMSDWDFDSNERPCRNEKDIKKHSEFADALKEIYKVNSVTPPQAKAWVANHPNWVPVVIAVRRVHRSLRVDTPEIDRMFLSDWKERRLLRYLYNLSGRIHSETMRDFNLLAKQIRMGISYINLYKKKLCRKENSSLNATGSNVCPKLHGKKLPPIPNLYALSRGTRTRPKLRFEDFFPPTKRLHLDKKESPVTLQGSGDQKSSYTPEPHSEH